MSRTAQLTSFDTQMPASSRRGWVIIGLAVASWGVFAALGYGVVQVASFLVA